MAVISLKGLLMDKGARSVDSWASQVINQIERTREATERVYTAWQCSRARKQMPWVSLYVASQYRALEMHGPYAGQVMPVYLKWRALTGLSEVVPGVKPGTQIDWVEAEDETRFKPEARVLWSHVKRHHRELLPTVRQYEMASKRLRADMQSLTGVIRALDQVQSDRWVYQDNKAREDARELLKSVIPEYEI